MNTATLFGIKNCDTVKKARRWLDQQNIEYTFVDFRQQPLVPETVQTWIEAIGVNKLLNKRSTTWKNLTETEKNRAETDDLCSLLCANPTLIKRPLLELSGTYHVGFSEKAYSDIFA